MIFNIFFKEIKKNYLSFIINAIFLSLVFAIIIVVLSISSSLPSKYKNLIDDDARIFVTRKVTFEKYNFRDYYLVWNTVFSDVYLLDETKKEKVELVISDKMALEDDKMYIDKELYDKIGLNSNINLTIEDNQFFSEKTFGFQYEIIDAKYEAVYFSKAFYQQLNNASMTLAISVNSFDDVEKAYSFFSSVNIDFEEYDNGYYSLYKSVIIVEKSLFIITVLLIVYMVFMAYNLMDSYTNKRNSFIGLLKNYGFENKKIFLLYFMLTVFLELIASVFGTVISIFVLNSINDLSVISFDTNFNFQLIWYVPIIILLSFIICFVLFFGRAISSNLRKKELIDFLKGGVY